MRFQETVLAISLSNSYVTVTMPTLSYACQLKVIRISSFVIRSDLNLNPSIMLFQQEPLPEHKQ